MGSIMSYLNYVDVETPEGKSLTVVTDKQEGPSLMSVVGMTVRCMCLLVDT